MNVLKDETQEKLPINCAAYVSIKSCKFLHSNPKIINIS